MNIRSSIEKILNLKDCGIAGHILLAPLTLASHAYGAAMSLRASMYRNGIFRIHNIGVPVVSVGNITIGGTGKTPTVCMLARRLSAQGLRVTVLTRGYRGSCTHNPLIVSDGSSLQARTQEAGDEAVMLAGKLEGIPVIAGRDCVAAGILARTRFDPHIVVLDDGFQHLRLHRAVDIVLVNAANPFGNGFTLPRGTLRENLSALERAHIVLLTKTDTASSTIADLRTTISARNPRAPIFTSSFRIVSLKNAHTGERVQVKALAGAHVTGLCSIGDPTSFIAMLSRLPMQINECAVFPDHHQYSTTDYRRIKRLLLQADAIITTEKDIAKIDLGMLQNGMILVLEIEQTINEEDLFLTSICNYLNP